MAFTKYLEQKFSKHGDLVLGAIAGTLSTVNACLLLYNRRQLVGREKDSGCVETSMPGLV